MKKIFLLACLLLSIGQASQAQNFNEFAGKFELINTPKKWTTEDLKTWILMSQEIPQDLTSFFPNTTARKYYPFVRFESGNAVIVLFADFAKDGGYDVSLKQQIHLHALNFDKKTGKALGVNNSYIFSAGGDGKMEEKYTGKMETDGKTFLQVFNESSKKESSAKKQYKISKKGLSFEKHLD